jgi:hypothetical protein
LLLQSALLPLICACISTVWQCMTILRECCLHAVLAAAGHKVVALTSHAACHICCCWLPCHLTGPPHARKRGGHSAGPHQVLPAAIIAAWGSVQATPREQLAAAAAAAGSGRLAALQSS